jgi:hypothetical protein
MKASAPLVRLPLCQEQGGRGDETDGGDLGWQQ